MVAAMAAIPVWNAVAEILILTTDDHGMKTRIK
jgi:hypothetical protein